MVPAPRSAARSSGSSERSWWRSRRASASRGIAQTTATSARTKYRATIRITLEVHPWFGREALVLGSRGDDAVWAELPDGRTCHLPIAWTDHRPRPAPLGLSGQPVRLDPTGALQLARWIAARRDRRKLDSPDPEDQKARDGVAGARRAASPAAVVGKAGAARAGRSGRRQHRRGKQ